VAQKTPPVLAPIAFPLLAALALVLAACGGGSTAGPIAQSSVATTTSAAPASTQAGDAPSATAPTPTAPRTTTAPSPRPAARPDAARPRSPGAALADAPPASAGEPSSTTEDELAPVQAPPTSPLDERANLVLTRRVTNTHYFQQGTVTGTYEGTMETEARITSKGVLVSFTATLPGGTISGRAVAVAILDSTTWPGLRGRAIITGGTGRFAGIHGRRLRVTGRSKPDASRTRVRLVGTTSLG
jgi:hypothetical protein